MRSDLDLLELQLETLFRSDARGRLRSAAMRRAGLIPLYRTSWDNAALLEVARRLGLVLYGEDFHLT
jgi:hypothetical protein